MPNLFSALSLPELVLVFGLSASAVAGAGVVLARSGDSIAERTGLGGLVIGMLLLAVDPAQAVAGVGAILLMAVALAAVVHGTETRIRRLEPDAVAVLVIYVLMLGAVWASTA